MPTAGITESRHIISVHPLAAFHALFLVVVACSFSVVVMFALDAFPFAAPLVLSSSPGALFLSSWVLRDIAKLFCVDDLEPMLSGTDRFLGCRLRVADDSTCFRLLCPLSLSLVASRSHLSETSRLTNEGTAWPRQVPSVSLPEQPRNCISTLTGSNSSSCRLARNQLLAQHGCFQLPAGCFQPFFSEAVCQRR